MKRIFTPAILTILCLSMISQAAAIVSSTTSNDYRVIDIFGTSPMQHAGAEIKQRSSGDPPSGLVVPVAEKNNISIAKNMEGNRTISDQYIITLKDEVTRTPQSLQNALDNLTAKIQSEGAKVIYVYKQAIKGLAIKVPDQHMLAQLFKDLKNDPRVAAIEPDKTMQAFSAANN
jgi:hypothetical protein